MTVYLIQVFLILILSAGFHPASNIKGRKYFFILIFMLLTVVSGYRGYTVGADTKIYVRLFENIESLPVVNPRFEPGFVLYLKLLNFVSDEPGYMLFFSSFFCIGSSLYLAYHFSKKPTISVLLYILLGHYFSQMNTMRQSVAMSIVIWAFVILLDDNKKRIIKNKMMSAVLIVLAGSFHTIAILAFIPWVLNLRLERSDEESKMTTQFAVFYTLFIAIIVYSAYSLIMRLAMSFFPSYAHYFSGIWSDSNYSASLLNTLMYLTFLVVGGIVLRGRRLTNVQRFSVIMLSLSIVFQVLSMRMEIWGRATGMFSIYALVIWVPEFLNEIKLLTNRWIVESTVVLSSLTYMLIVLIYRPEWTMVVPYVFR